MQIYRENRECESIHYIFRSITNIINQHTTNLNKPRGYIRNKFAVTARKIKQHLLNNIFLSFFYTNYNVTLLTSLGPVSHTVPNAPYDSLDQILNSPPEQKQQIQNRFENYAQVLEHGFFFYGSNQFLLQSFIPSLELAAKYFSFDTHIRNIQVVISEEQGLTCYHLFFFCDFKHGNQIIETMLFTLKQFFRKDPKNLMSAIYHGFELSYSSDTSKDPLLDKTFGYMKSIMENYYNAHVFPIKAVQKAIQLALFQQAN